MLKKHYFIQYLKYIKMISQMKQLGVIDSSYRVRSFLEWHEEDFVDRVESYFIDEYMQDFGEVAYNLEDSDEIYDFILDIIEECYFEGENVPNTTLLVNNYLKMIS